MLYNAGRKTDSPFNHKDRSFLNLNNGYDFFSSPSYVPLHKEFIPELEVFIDKMNISKDSHDHKTILILKPSLFRQIRCQSRHGKTEARETKEQMEKASVR